MASETDGALDFWSCILASEPFAFATTEGEREREIKREREGEREREGPAFKLCGIRVLLGQFDVVRSGTAQTSSRAHRCSVFLRLTL